MSDGHVHEFNVPGIKIDPKKDTITPGTRVRCAWEVVAGIVPGRPEPEYTRRWIITSEAWEKDLKESEPIRAMSQEEYKAWVAAGNHLESTYQKFQNAAMVYAQSLQNPQGYNWVQLVWLWY